MNFWLLSIPLFILIVGYFFFPQVIAFAKKAKYLDEGDGRKRHKNSVPPIGGWLLYAAFSLSFLIVFPYNIANFFVFLSVTGIFLLGVVDDKYPMNASKKFLGQFLVAGLLVFGGQIHFADYMSLFGIPYFLGQALCAVAIVFIVNAYNLVDGINGLAAMLGIVAIGYLGLWLFSAGLYNHFILALSILAALFVFLRYNLFQTQVFLGDNGSMIIGLMAVYFAFIFIKTYTGFTSIVLTKCNAEVGIALVAMAIPIADTLRLFILRPYYLSKSPFKADRNHVHHLLIRLGLSHIEASLLLFGLSILLVMASLAAQDLGSIAVVFITFSILVAFLMSLDFFVFNRFRKQVDKKTVFNSLKNLSNSLNNPKFIEYIFATSIFLLAISIPFHRVSTSIPTIILVFSFIVLFFRNVIVYNNKYWIVFNSKFRQFLKHPYSIIILSLFLYLTLHVTILNPSDNWYKTSLYLLLFVYWISIFQLEKIIHIKPRYLLTAFIMGCVGFGVFIILQSFVDFPQKGWDGFFYKGLLNHVKANPVTHSLYYNLAILFLGNNYKNIKKEKWRITNWLLLVFFIFMVILCSAKIGYFILFFTILTAIYNMLPNKRTARITIAIFSIFCFFIALQAHIFNVEFLNSAFQIKLIVWKESMAIIKENFWLGIGIGNSIEVLKESFTSIGFEKGVLQKYNAQNQFLESFIETGFFGFLLLVILFAYNFVIAFVERNRLYFVYTCVILVYMMTESLFQTQMGMVSFAFFNALFLAAFNTKKDRV